MAEYSDEDFAAAARYVRHDFGRATVASVLEEFGMKRPEKEEESKEGDPKAPPEKTPEEKASEKPKKRGIWWPSEAEKSD